MNILAGKKSRYTWASGVGALLLVAGLAAGMQSAAAAGTPMVRPHQFVAASSTKGLKALGTVPNAQNINLSVVLSPNNTDALQALLKNLYNPKSPLYHHWLTPAQFNAEFGPTPSTVRQVESWLHSRGLVSTTQSGSAIKVSAPAGTVSSALGTSFENYRSHSGSEGYLAQQAPLVPETLASGQIQSILGLNTVSKYVPEVVTSKASIQSRAKPGQQAHVGLQPHADGLTPCSGATNEATYEGVPNSFWTLDQLGADYGVGNLLFQGQNGTGQTIGVFELAAHSPADVSTYLNCFGLHNSVTTVTADGGAGNPGGSGTTEADLDIEQSATQAPDASIVSYEAPNSQTGVYDAWNAMINPSSGTPPQVLSTSWGECEPDAASVSGNGSMSSLDLLFEQAAVDGQSIFAATGDSGSEDCFPDGVMNSDYEALETDYPSSDTNVTAVGGTSFSDPGYETAWNYCQTDESLACAGSSIGLAGGGGVSDYWTPPAGQPVNQPGETQIEQSSCNDKCRETPDVSSNAGVGMVIYDDGAWDVEAGTSFAAPLWAGIQADRNVGCTASSTSTGGAGDVSQSLYALYNAGVGKGADAYNNSYAFTDITSGDNDLTGQFGTDYPATTGYDLATGIGSPIAPGLSCPEVTGVTEGPSSGQATISGRALVNAAFTFGGTPATVVSETASSATVNVPPGSGTVTVQATNEMGTGSLPAPPSFTYPTISNTSLAPGSESTPYSDTLTATGGVEPYTFSIVGTPPSWLSMTSAGVITGTPTSPGTASITFEVTDADGVSSTAVLPIQIYAYGSTTTASVIPTSIEVGGSVTYSATVTATTGTNPPAPTGTVTFSVGSTTLCTTSSLPTTGPNAGEGSCTAANAPMGVDAVTATYSGDTNFAPSVGTAQLEVTSGPYSPLTPVRVCDTRAGNPSNLSGPAEQCNGDTIQTGGTQTFNVANADSTFGVPADATAVVLNVTAVNPAASGYLTVFPAGATQPFASNLNYTAGQVIPNLVEVGTGTSGDISIYSKSKTDVVVDLEGYVAPTASGGAGAGLYTALNTADRICDTRGGNPSGLSGPEAQCNGYLNLGESMPAGSTKSIAVAGQQFSSNAEDNIPSGATAVVLNVTVVNPNAPGYLTVFPQGQPQPFTANVNYSAGQTTGNRVIVPLSTTGGTPGEVSIYSKAAANVVVDVSGYYTAAGATSGSEFTAEPAPVRICDTRPLNPSQLSGEANQCDDMTLSGPDTDTVCVEAAVCAPVGSALAGIPSNATAVVVNLTAVSPTAGTFLTVFPGGIQPYVSDLNPAAGEVKGNLTVATINQTTGQISIYNNTGLINVVVDVMGWYSPVPA